MECKEVWSSDGSVQPFTNRLSGAVLSQQHSQTCVQHILIHSNK